MDQLLSSWTMCIMLYSEICAAVSMCCASVTIAKGMNRVALGLSIISLVSILVFSLYFFTMMYPTTVGALVAQLGLPV